MLKFVIALFLISMSYYAICSNDGELYYSNESDVHVPVGVAENIISDLNDASKVIYINASSFVSHTTIFDLVYGVKGKVLDENYRYFFDFSTIEDAKVKDNVKEKFLHAFGVSFVGDFIILTRFNHEFMYTQLRGRYDDNVKLLDAVNDLRIIEPNDGYKIDKDKAIPSFDFYLNVNKSISDKDCAVDWNTSNGMSRTYLCKDANISLIYYVSLRRSLLFQNESGSSTPDAKYVNISIGRNDKKSEGSGIHLNNELYPQIIMSNGILWPSGGEEAEWTSSAIAKSYRFNFKASNSKARIISTMPKSNVNSNFNATKTMSTEYGLSTLNPKELLTANHSWSESLALSFNVHDYRIIKNSRSARNVTFQWEREQYPTAESIKNASLEGISVRKDYPGDLSKIHPIAFSGFSPSIAVNYIASASSKGTTNFTINSSVRLTGFRFRSSITAIFGVRTYYSKDSDDQSVNLSKSASFTVDWEHPIFLGAWPVNLQLGDFNNKCINVAENNKLTIKRCDFKDMRQAFIYDRLGRYISVNHNRFCLDATSFPTLKRCNQNLSQRWKWSSEGTSRTLSNKYKNLSIAYSKKDALMRTVRTGKANTDLSVNLLTSSFPK
ncbi:MULTISPECIES: leukocidin family pore-forming toxin [unclassified Shewanella]|uniref:leukocidin family pore-forming toxin n=1 Tax=unclassified Shewanella TaxID=196818 RepID=UPI001BB86BAE|nr:MULTISPECIES: leukocidin family pore-forming toxin [unclassified Shewanella]GIU05675.1 hemolysin [Shewanella sp. MBTL60-112-B1]GIU25948.1 hemolysin [Shewanella sp. MBTL60-112-B2]